MQGTLELREGVVAKVLGMKPTDIFAATMSDLAAKGVAREFDQEGEECDMHQGERSEDLQLATWFAVSTQL